MIFYFVMSFNLSASTIIIKISNVIETKWHVYTKGNVGNDVSL